MVTVEYLWDRIKSKFPDKSEKEILEAMMDLGMETEIKGDIISIEFEPDRFDWVSKEGIIRTLKNYFYGNPKKYEIKEYKYEIRKEGVPYRPYIVGLVAKGLNLDEEDIREIMQFQEKISETLGRKRRKFSIGFYKLDEIEFPIYYKLMNPEEIRFVPLGMEEEMNALEILERHEKGIKYGHLIKDYEKFPVLVDSRGKILSLAPIINSNDVGRVDENTRNVFVDLTGTDLDVMKKVLNIIACDLIDRGAEVFGVVINGELRVPDMEYKKMEIKYDDIRRMIGLEIGNEEIRSLLKRMGHLIEEDFVLVPPYRLDIRDDLDIIEDVARAFGYENIGVELPRKYSIGEIRERTRIRREVTELLTGLGFYETMSFIIINKDLQTKKMGVNLDVIELENSIEKEMNSLRAWILPSVLNTLSINKAEEKPIKIFEIDYVVVPDPEKENRSRDELHLGIAIYGKDANYTKIRQVLEYLFDRFGKKVIFKEYNHPSFIEGRCAEILFHGERVGFVGEIHPEVLENFGLEFPVAAAEIDLERLFHF